MGQKRLLGNNPLTGVQHSIEIDHDGGGFTAVEFTPTSVENEILDSCSRLRNLHQTSKSRFQLAARTPVGLNALWRKEWEQKYRDKMKWMEFKVMKLNSRDYERLRTGHKDSGSKKL